MKAAQRRRKGRPALDLIEEAIHLLRTAPAAVLVGYYLGTLPFVLALLYFWADMSRSPFAPQHVVEASLGIAASFVWMKSWQAVFAGRLRDFASGATLPPLTLRRGLRIATGQAALQSTGLFLWPLAAIPVLPFAWVYAFYQNLTALGDTENTTAGGLFRRSARQARLWPEQNFTLLICLGAFGGFVFLNCCVGCGLLPHLIKMLLGVETVFTRGGTAMLNTTFFAAMFWLTYLCVDPILKAVYVLRCFYGDSIQSGADLRAELQQSQTASPARYAVWLLTALMLSPAAELRASDAPTPAPPAVQPVSPSELDRAIDETIQERKYTWRMPRERVERPPEENQPGIIAEFFNRIGRMIRDVLKNFFDWLGRILNKLFGGRSFSFNPGGTGSGWAVMLEILPYVLLAAALSAMTILLYRFWRNRHLRREPISTEILQSVPDLQDENVGADQLPEDGWTKLARELLARGEFRLALRAFYLASLAHLAERNLISLARFKSNRDYERELDRRAHSFPNLRQRFGENVNAFDRVWYGTHQATSELVAQFATNVESIRSGG